jgi:hypothetical protein
MRLWEDERPGEAKSSKPRDYETVGYMIGVERSPRCIDEDLAAERKSV